MQYEHSVDIGKSKQNLWQNFIPTKIINYYYYYYVCEYQIKRHLEGFISCCRMHYKIKIDTYSTIHIHGNRIIISNSTTQLNAYQIEY